MNELSRVLVSAGLAIVLVCGILITLAFNPWLALGLAPVLVSVSLVIRAVRGTASAERASEVSSRNQASAE